jgi:hypothetical protein
LHMHKPAYFLPFLFDCANVRWLLTLYKLAS